MNISGQEFIQAMSAIGAGIAMIAHAVAETTGLYGLAVAIILMFVQPFKG